MYKLDWISTCSLRQPGRQEDNVLHSHRNYLRAQHTETMLQPRGTITSPRPCIRPAGRTRHGKARCSVPLITRVRSGGLQIGLEGRTDQYYWQYDFLDVSARPKPLVRHVTFSRHPLAPRGLSDCDSEPVRHPLARLAIVTHCSSWVCCYSFKLRITYICTMVLLYDYMY